MDVFNTKRVAELEHKIYNLEQENSRLRNQLHDETRRADVAEKHLKAMDATLQNAPEDCKPGKYCEGCGFAKSYFIRSYPRTGMIDTGIYCGKGESCKNFVQKELNA